MEDNNKDVITKWLQRAAGLEIPEGVYTRMEAQQQFYFIDRIFEEQVCLSKSLDDILSLEKAHAQNYLDIVNAIIVVIDTNQCVRLMNKKGCEMLGYEESEVVGKNWFNNFIPLNDRNKTVVAFAGLVAGQIEPAEYFENEIITKSGKVRTIAWHNTVFKDERGMVMATLSSGEDVTERNQACNKIKNLNKRLVKTNKRLNQLALRDSHTGLYNHRYLEDVIEAEFARSQRLSVPLSVIMIDIDYFKSINDVYGHQFGDLVIKQFAASLKKLVRRYDVVIRFGGEEFVVLSPMTDKAGAVFVADRILYNIGLQEFGNKNQKVKIKITAAIVSYPEEGDWIKDGIGLISLADKTLDRAKNEGGNRVCSSSDARKQAAEYQHTAEKDIVDANALREKVEKLTKLGNQSAIEAIMAFAKTIEAKDRYTGEHGERTVYYVTKIAEALKLSQTEKEAVKQAAVLHDLGKVGISERILSKKSKLTTKEFQQIRKHPQLGVDILRPIHSMHDIIPFVLCHHERWDGSGYPLGFKGEEIPLGARIIAVADTYQALTSDRPYRKALSKKEAMQIIKQGSGTHFDPTITEIFLKIAK